MSAKLVLGLRLGIEGTLADVRHLCLLVFLDFHIIKRQLILELSEKSSFPSFYYDLDVDMNAISMQETL